MTLSDAQERWSLSAEQVDRMWKLVHGWEIILPGGQLGYRIADLEWALEQIGREHGLSRTTDTRRRRAA